MSVYDRRTPLESLHARVSEVMEEVQDARSEIRAARDHIILTIKRTGEKIIMSTQDQVAAMAAELQGFEADFVAAVNQAIAQQSAGQQPDLTPLKAAIDAFAAEDAVWKASVTPAPATGATPSTGATAAPTDTSITAAPTDTGTTTAAPDTGTGTAAPSV